ncbi:hypothetical protein TNCV_2464981 [Trichonephila clavipes]|uniref:Uncharacterized protein n=1 Tax=Trichonephila clavipes TaxID=2585209 RepID=A0A8X6R3S7_TRICX|nr:hypothetical protein TNCV_2464981 [Trichonephila clavipes]
MATKIDKLKSKRTILRSAVTKLENKATRILETDPLDIQELKIFKFQLIEKQNQLKEIDNQTEQIITDLKELEKEIEDNEKYLEKFIRISCQIDLKLEFSLSENSKILVNASNSESISMSKQTVNLPKFDLPNSSGALEDWISFKQIFVTTIHENSEHPHLFRNIKCYNIKLWSNAVSCCGIMSSSRRHRR